ncbi:hypothetical protein NIES2104_21870 [Leptolyngbya sp. NIES-2104]|nr:hypothetical protein NIES2104_21870 [Leptolyngbya sp. NIES-2104]
MKHWFYAPDSPLFYDDTRLKCDRQYEKVSDFKVIKRYFVPPNFVGKLRYP